MAEGAEDVPVVYLHDIKREYRQGEATLTVLNGAKLALWPGQSVALVAPSGSGKSTLLHIAGLLERPDERRGLRLRHAEPSRHAPTSMPARQMRRAEIGFVYQFAPPAAGVLGARERHAAADDRRLKRSETVKRSTEILSYLGLADRITHRPAELSGGEQQRVAIARAVANAPRVLLADEPTGNLDPGTADHVFNALMQLVKATRVAMLIATHNLDLAARMDRRVSLANGQIVELE
jgi:lipoprotein-releasing system ATP-binding protein